MENINTKTIVFYAVLFIAMLVIIFVGGRYVQRLPPNLVKRINTISFGLAIGSGILLYMFHKAIFMYLFLATLVIYFISFNYKEGQKEG
ncbi:MAG: hypothetical protein A2X87_08690 [Deltaproteobacteria bacterium GWC2_42_51]|nr:MAG: hypothetical protein A2X87_08690 [Deltaproteobacteria bacterium GWC2_42_51]OGP42927.1 MAG: hypothetical protein A2090_10170 [Deltaproteobacteria bacterium GWD2_42_10]OGQ75984.1 MAG: hypothetical protein A2235_06485 [Deltaproteobacteria bacterium RIFOXYA2_FULL_42_10]HAS17043.1 hypothetical protein [Nitrospiraceae bacterium]